MHGKFIFVIILSVSISGQLLAHSGKPKYHVIIDTDGGVDDLRALTMFLSGNDIRVLGITCSQGNLLSDSVYDKVISLLSIFRHEGIQVGIGEKSGKQLPAGSSFAQSIPWGERTQKNLFEERKEAILLLNRITEDYSEKITLIALGSLKTFADWIKSNPEIRKKIDRIIWYNDPLINTVLKNKTSPNSYNYIRQSGIELVNVSNTSNKFTIDDAYLDAIKKRNSRYARQIVKVLSLHNIKDRRKEKGLQLLADIVPLYLTVPILFESEVKDCVRIAELNQGIPESYIYETIGTLLESATTTNNKVFNKFPLDSALYKPEYAKILQSTIEKFGLIEWKAICMTNEIHGHTGIYSIIGAKMGIRAMEFFNVGVNNLYVTTFAGIKPPLSCFNDGIQISSGATIGQGLITISDSVSEIPTALFEFNSRILKISLKPEIAAQMQREIAFGVQTFGLLTEQYWLYIEKLAIQYWQGLSRYEIFDLEID